MGAPWVRVRVEREGGVCVLAVRGELDIATTPELARQVAAAFEIAPARLVLDLSGLEFIDCAGARALEAVVETVPADCPVTVGSMSCAAQRVLGVLEMNLERPGAAAAGEVPWTVLERRLSQQPRAASRRRRADSQRRRAEIASRLRLWPRVKVLGRAPR